MKKLLLIGSIFLILGVTIFYFGWIQLKVDKDEYGIVFTKVRGYLDKPLVPGKFSLLKSQRFLQLPEQFSSQADKTYHQMLSTDLLLWEELISPIP